MPKKRHLLNLFWAWVKNQRRVKVASGLGSFLSESLMQIKKLCQITMLSRRFSYIVLSGKFKFSAQESDLARVYKPHTLITSTADNSIKSTVLMPTDHKLSPNNIWKKRSTVQSKSEFEFQLSHYQSCLLVIHNDSRAVASGGAGGG